MFRGTSIRNRDGRDVTFYGVDASGASDTTEAIKACLEQGGVWYFPAGTYYIRGYGELTNRGGVDVTLTNNLSVTCHPNAVFTARQAGVDTVTPLDNDFFVFRAPAGGVGIPPEKITFSWVNGFFDQTTQCVSTSVPFLSTYPPPTGRVGSSGTCEGISLRFSYDVSGTTYGAARSCYIGDVVFYAGEHWETAGGDSAIFIGAGSGQGKIERCYFFGCRDLGVYCSGIASGRQGLIATDCYFEACFGGISAKRGLSSFTYRSNTFRNCVAAMAASPLVRTSEYGVITGNTIDGCSVVFRFSQSDSNYFGGNQILSMGAYLADGTTAVAPYGLQGIWLAGAQNNVIRDITCPVINAGQPGAIMVLLEDQNGDTASRNIIERVWTTDFGRCVENKGTGTLNRVINCFNFGSAGLPDPLMTSGDWVVRYAASGGDTYRNPLLFANGSAAAPIISRETQANTGIFFGTSQIGLSTNGASRFDVNTSRAAFMLPVQLQSYTTAQRDALSSPQAGWVIFNTTTGTLQTYNGSAWV